MSRIRCLSSVSMNSRARESRPAGSPFALNVNRSMCVYESDPTNRLPFHLGNGARLERLNWMGDSSAKGLSEAAGFMVNYLYDLGSVERNHEAYANKDEIVASPEMQRLERALLRA